MIKHVILLIIFSILAVLFASQLQHVIKGLLIVYQQVASWYALIFTHGTVGELIRHVLTFLTIPVVVGLVASLFFWLLKRSVMPHTMATIWIVWVILLVATLSKGIN